MLDTSVQLHGSLDKKDHQKFHREKHTAAGDIYRFLTGKRKITAGRDQLEIHGFSKTSEVAELDEMVVELRDKGSALVAVASAKVYNEPNNRRRFEQYGVEPLVCDPQKVERKELLRWIDAVIEGIGTETRQVTPTAHSATEMSPVRDEKSGLLDARKISALMGISLTDTAKICGVSKQALSQSSTGKSYQAKLQPFEDIASALPWFGGDEGKLRAWLLRPNRDFPKIAGKALSPMDVILRGHPDVVADKLHNLRVGHPA
jgi:hypothetical protein